jgi:hypothetical protein
LKNQEQNYKVKKRVKSPFHLKIRVETSKPQTVNRGGHLKVFASVFFKPRSFSPHSHALCTEILWAPEIEPGLAKLSLKASRKLLTN